MLHTNKKKNSICFRRKIKKILFTKVTSYRFIYSNHHSKAPLHYETRLTTRHHLVGGLRRHRCWCRGGWGCSGSGGRTLRRGVRLGSRFHCGVRCRSFRRGVWCGRRCLSSHICSGCCCFSGGCCCFSGATTCCCGDLFCWYILCRCCHLVSTTHKHCKQKIGIIIL